MFFRTKDYPPLKQYKFGLNLRMIINLQPRASCVNSKGGLIFATKHIIVARIFVIILLLANASGIFGQSFKLPFYTIGAGGVFSAGRQIPFWLVSDQFGKNSTKPSAGFLDALLETKTNPSRRFDYNYGLELFERYDGGNAFWVHQAYISARYRFICLRFGNKEEVYGNQDSLSMGSTLWSKNARPIPQVVLSSNGYVDIPFTKGYMQVSGLLSHGWFGNEGYVKDVYLHHKYLYVKVGGRFPVNVSYGLEHYAQWGGVHPVLGELPSGWDAYKRIFMAREGNSDDPATPIPDTLNRLGNHLGSRQYGIDIKLKKVCINTYYQTIFEDNSGKREYFMRDGLWGIALRSRSKNRIVNSLVYELFRSVYQSGGFQPDINETFSIDNYFNHFLYENGWTYHGFTIGTPFITSPVLNTEPVTGIVNNCVIAHHFAIAGIIQKKINYNLHVTWSKNKGTFQNPFPETLNSTSALLQISNDYQQTGGFEAVVQLAFDIGEMYGNNLGIGITIRKHGIF